MKLYQVESLAMNPQCLQALIFDIDHTLYRDDRYGPSQNPLLIQRLAQERGWTELDAQRRVADVQRQLQEQFGGRSPSMGECLLELGISMEQNVRWRSELMQPELYLGVDSRLRSTLEAFAPRRMVAVTNNPTAVGRRTLRVLGVEDLFVEVFGLDTCYRSKPHPCVFEHAVAALGCSVHNVVAVGDRFDIDLQPVLQMGGAAVLVESMDDVYALPSLLLNGAMRAEDVQ